MEALYLPSMPPASPYDAYVFLLVIPFLFRLVMVFPPLIDLIQKFGGDAKWYLAKIRGLRIKGLGLLLMNEILALTLPFFLAFYARTIFDPLGWPDWGAVPSAGYWVLIIAGILWLWADLLRVARTRRLLRAVSERNPYIAKAAVQLASSTRDALDWARLFSPLDRHSDVVAAESYMNGMEEKEETTAQKVLRKVKDHALVAAESLAEVVREKAEVATENIDAKIDSGVRSHAQTSLKLLVRDITMSLAPIAVLVLLHQFW